MNCFPWNIPCVKYLPSDEGSITVDFQFACGVTAFEVTTSEFPTNTFCVTTPHSTEPSLIGDLGFPPSTISIPYQWQDPERALRLVVH